MAENKFTLNDTQARFKIMENFYEEVTSMMLKRFLLILWYRATGSKPDENSDILFNILQYLRVSSNHVLREKFGSQLYTEPNKSSSTPKTGVEVSKFDLSLSKAFLTGVDGFPSSSSHPKGCIFCEKSCTTIQLGRSAKQPCNNCTFCSSPSGNCKSVILRKYLSFAGKTRNTGSHSSQSQCLSHPLMSEDIEENIKAITMLYEYLYTDENWKKFHEKWVNYTKFHEIKEKIQLIKSSPIEELREIFKSRLQSDSEILRRIDNIQENIAKMNTNSTKSSFIMCLQLSVSKTAAQNNAKLDDLLNNAQLFLLESRLSTLIYNVINQAVKNIGINNFEVNIQDFKSTILPGLEKYEQLQVALDINSQDEGVFVDYSNIRKAKSKVLSQEIKESFFKELKNDVHIMDKCEITPEHVILAFKTWKLGSLHVVLSLRKKTKRVFSQQEVDIVMQVINRVIKSRRRLFEAEFGTSVQITTKMIPPKSGVKIFTTNLTVGALREENISMDDFASKLQETTEVLLTKQLQLEDCSKVKAPLAVMLQMTEDQIHRLSLLSTDVWKTARMSSVNAYLAHTLQWFMLTVKIAPNEKIFNSDYFLEMLQEKDEDFRGDLGRKKNDTSNTDKLEQELDSDFGNKSRSYEDMEEEYCNEEVKSTENSAWYRFLRNQVEKKISAPQISHLDFESSFSGLRSNYSLLSSKGPLLKSISAPEIVVPTYDFDDQSLYSSIWDSSTLMSKCPLFESGMVRDMGSCDRQELCDHLDSEGKYEKLAHHLQESEKKKRKKRAEKKMCLII